MQNMGMMNFAAPSFGATGTNALDISQIYGTGGIAMPQLNSGVSSNPTTDLFSSLAAPIGTSGTTNFGMPSADVFSALSAPLSSSSANNPMGTLPNGSPMDYFSMITDSFTTNLLSNANSLASSIINSGALDPKNYTQWSISNMLGGLNLSGSAGSGNSTTVTSGAGINSTAAMQKLAATSKQMLAQKGSTNGQCVRGVNDTLAMIYGEKNIKRVGSAYQEADVLAGDSRFKEIKGLSKDQLKSLPAGCIIIWSGNLAGSGGHGHATITQGDGTEISDHRQDVIIGGAGTTFRVFVPVQ
jgi:hypothetical protein